MDLIELCEPKSVALVNGERAIMQCLQRKIIELFKLICLVPYVGETCTLHVPIKIPTNAKKFLEKTKNSKQLCAHLPHPNRRPRMTNVLLIRNNHIVPMLIEDALKLMHPTPFKLTFSIEYKFYDPDPNWGTINKLFIILKGKLLDWNVLIRNDRTITVQGVEVKLVKNRRNPSQTLLNVTWRDRDEDITFYILDMFERMS